MSDFELTRPVGDNLLQTIYKELGEDADRLKNRQELFKQWIDCEEHLPKNIDQRIIDNFIRLSKFDIERAKRKFEMWLYARTNHSNLFGQLSTSELLSVHRQVLISSDMTEDGYRVLLITFKNLDVENYDFEQTIRYGFLYADYFLLRDINSGVKVIFDWECFNARILHTINIAQFKTVVDIVTTVQPQRLKQIHMVNIPNIAHGLYMIARTIMPEKIKQRIVLHKDMSTVMDHIKPNKILPNEFGGTDGNLQDLADGAKEFLVNDEKLHAERDKCVLAGKLPMAKMKMYMYDQHGVAGSFRTLQID